MSACEPITPLEETGLPGYLATPVGWEVGTVGISSTSPTEREKTSLKEKDDLLPKSEDEVGLISIYHCLFQGVRKTP